MVEINKILGIILLIECIASIYIIPKLIGEMDGLQLEANRDRNGVEYGGAHYVHGMSDNVCVCMLPGFIIEFVLLFLVEAGLSNFLPYTISSAIVCIVFGVFLALMLKVALDTSKENEKKLQSMRPEDRVVGPDYYKYR